MPRVVPCGYPIRNRGDSRMVLFNHAGKFWLPAPWRCAVHGTGAARISIFALAKGGPGMA